MESIVVSDMEHCFICGSNQIQIHHIFYGTANRKKSDKYKLVIPLCIEHHTGSCGIHRNRDFDLMVKRMAQEKFENAYSRDLFMQEFGKNWR